jgi:hypothetical protein
MTVNEAVVAATERDERRTKAIEAATAAFVSFTHKMEALVVVVHRLAEVAECELNEERNRRRRP